ncbi:MAG TPA: DnaA/Hda family protein, partial [Candidatus Hydrogenedentes bacterium]|nr:DnaA/Hda family protein [Candidatus Hydrogenedentota bacterium]
GLRSAVWAVPFRNRIMKNFTFDKFIRHPSNVAAYDFCERLSRLDPTLANPIVLLGESGAGKTHLLWAIVNQYRAVHAPAGVALISQSSFPDVVKELATKPEKLTTGTPVVVLVDDLHAFDSTTAGDLEKILFALDTHGHRAILATRKHPLLISALSGKCKALLSRGVIVAMAPLPENTRLEMENGCILSLPGDTGTEETASPLSEEELPEALSAQARQIGTAVADTLAAFEAAWEEGTDIAYDTHSRAAWEECGKSLCAFSKQLETLADELLLLSTPGSPQPPGMMTTESAPEASDTEPDGAGNNRFKEY